MPYVEALKQRARGSTTRSDLQHRSDSANAAKPHAAAGYSSPRHSGGDNHKERGITTSGRGGAGAEYASPGLAVMRVSDKGSYGIDGYLQRCG